MYFAGKTILCMKIYIVYNMPEDREEFEAAQKAAGYSSLILDYINQLRRWGKADKAPEFEEIREGFYDLLQKYKYDE